MKRTNLINYKALRWCVAALLLFATTVANAYDFRVDGIFYNILSEEDLTCEVTYRYYNSSSNAAAYTDAVVIPETATYLGTTYSVVAIGDYAFNQCDELTEVTIPNTVTTIGDYAFYFCTGLMGELIIPNSVTLIGNWAFAGCRSLTGTLIIPESVTSIGNGAFYWCPEITQVSIPNSVTTIGYDTFDSCYGLIGTLIIPESVIEIGTRAFSGCSGLTEVNIGNGVTEIDTWAFSSCSGLTSVTIGESVETIGSSAFYNCSGLTSVTSLNPEPPSCANNVFYNVPITTCVLYVPLGATRAYSTATGWEDFFYIEEMEVDAIDDITANGNAKAVGYYTTDGKQVPSPQRGINIIRYSDGTARKTIVK